MTPLKNITKILAWIKYRRMLGLFAFFYGTLHLLTYIGLDYQFNLDPIILMLPLVVTSNQKMVLILKQNWKKIHRLSYLIGIFAVLHFIWLSKTIFFEPLIYLIILITLLTLRLDFIKFLLKKKSVT
jgi:sulfoxide reductase heme-binding subunit YedZ